MSSHTPFVQKDKGITGLAMILSIVGLIYCGSFAICQLLNRHSSVQTNTVSPVLSIDKAITVSNKTNTEINRTGDDQVIVKPTTTQQNSNSQPRGIKSPEKPLTHKASHPKHMHNNVTAEDNLVHITNVYKISDNQHSIQYEFKGQHDVAIKRQPPSGSLTQAQLNAMP